MTPSGEVLDLFLTQSGRASTRRFDVHDNGNYLASSPTPTEQQQRDGIITTGLSVPYSPSSASWHHLPLLVGVARRPTGGILAMNPRRTTSFDRNLPPTVSRQPVWRRVVQWLLLPLFLLDVADDVWPARWPCRSTSRRAVRDAVRDDVLAHAPIGMYVLALVMAEAIGWAIAAVHHADDSVFHLRRNRAGPGGTTQHADGSQLKTVRDKFARTWRSPPPRPPPSENATPGRSRWSRWPAARRASTWATRRPRSRPRT